MVPPRSVSGAPHAPPLAWLTSSLLPWSCTVRRAIWRQSSVWKRRRPPGPCDTHACLSLVPQALLWAELRARWRLCSRRGDPVANTTRVCPESSCKVPESVNASQGGNKGRRGRGVDTRGRVAGNRC